MNAYQKLINSTNKGSYLSVGLDPVLDRLPKHYQKNTDSIIDFCKKIVDSTQEYAAAYKINFAFFEQFGLEGFAILKELSNYIPHDILKIADAKRGDIGNTSKAYAKSIFDELDYDAITLSPYMGFDSIQPFLEYKDKLSIILALTSNKGSADFQRLISDGKPIYKHVLETFRTWTNYNSIAYVVGATHPQELEEIRELLGKETLLLIPGIGAQGGDLKSVLKANNKGLVLINSSRNIIYSSSGEDFAEAAKSSAKLLFEDINSNF